MNVNNYIISKILEGNSAGIDEAKYSAIIAEIDKGLLKSDICKYILSCAINACSGNDNCITFAKLLNMLASKFCVLKASEYMEYLQNSHEHIEEIETIKR